MKDAPAVEVEIEVVGQPKRKKVRCLGHCGQLFHPTHDGNRQCPRCTEFNSGINGRSFRVRGIKE